MAAEWLRSGGGVEIVSEREFIALREIGADVEDLLINGVAKHLWLRRYPLPRLRVHFDSLTEIDALLPTAVSARWRVGIRCHVPDERDAREPAFGGQFGMSRTEAIHALRRLSEVGADLQSIHFHLGQHRRHPESYRRAVQYVASVCRDAGVYPPILDCGGGLPSPRDAEWHDAFADLAAALGDAPSQFRNLREIWMEHGRCMSEESTVLVVRVADIKEREDSRYVICDGGRTNHALAADHGPHAIFTEADRDGPRRLTTVCGPTCMTDDRLGRWDLPLSLRVGDVIVWPDAGAYHLPWETRFSHGLCAIVWCDANESLRIVRTHESPIEAASRWRSHELIHG